MRDRHILLNANQQQGLLVSCGHIDKLLGDIEATLDAVASKGVFPDKVIKYMHQRGRHPQE